MLPPRSTINSRVSPSGAVRNTGLDNPLATAFTANAGADVFAGGGVKAVAGCAAGSLLKPALAGAGLAPSPPDPPHPASTPARQASNLDRCLIHVVIARSGRPKK